MSKEFRPGYVEVTVDGKPEWRKVVRVNQLFREELGNILLTPCGADYEPVLNDGEVVCRMVDGTVHIFQGKAGSL